MTGRTVDVAGLASEVMSRLEAAANPQRAAKGASYTPTGARIIGVTVPDMRRVARDAARELKEAPPHAVLALARALIDSHTLEGRQAGYEVLRRHKGVHARPWMRPPWSRLAAVWTTGRASTRSDGWSPARHGSKAASATRSSTIGRARRTGGGDARLSSRRRS